MSGCPPQGRCVCWCYVTLMEDVGFVSLSRDLEDKWDRALQAMLDNPDKAAKDDTLMEKLCTVVQQGERLRSGLGR